MPTAPAISRAARTGQEPHRDADGAVDDGEDLLVAAQLHHRRVDGIRASRTVVMTRAMNTKYSWWVAAAAVRGRSNRGRTKRCWCAVVSRARCGCWGSDLGAEELDALEEVGVRHAADVHLQDLAVVAEQLVQVQDALGDLVGAAGEDHAAGLAWLPRGPAAAMPGRPISAAPVANIAQLVLEVGRLGGGVVRADEPVDRDGDVGVVGGVADLGPRVAVGVAVLGPVLRRAAEDAEEHRDAELDGAADRAGAAAGAEPDPQRLLGARARSARR